MRRHVTRYIDHLHTKPEEERIQYALWGASIVTGIIFLVWLGFFFAKLSKPTLVIIPPAAADSAQFQVDKILQDAQLGLGDFGATQDTKTQDTGLPHTLDSGPVDSEVLYPTSSNPTSPSSPDPAADLRALFPRVN
jgi:hypothetical protein